MLLVSLSYSELQGTDYAWTLDHFDLGKVNLLVGKNATGKTRTINIISALGQLLSGDRKKVLHSGSFDVTFKDSDESLYYLLEQTNGVVVREELTKGDKLLLRRKQGSYGYIFAEEVKRDMRFDVPPQEVAVFAKRDSAQHPFLNSLIEWGSAVRHFEFGKTMGHTNLGIPMKAPELSVNERDTTQVIPIYAKGLKLFGDDFKQKIRDDMLSLGYHLDDLILRRPANLTIDSPIPLELVGIGVKESDLPGITDQLSMSQGMFRALSIIVQLNYCVMSQTAACILADDIGEGLDYDRSCQLIDILRTKCYESSVQLVMSTNDRFVMNKVPLEEWCYLVRNCNHVRILNYKNSKDSFDRFKVTGLNNFDLLTTHFLEQTAANGKTCNLR